MYFYRLWWAVSGVQMHQEDLRGTVPQTLLEETNPSRKHARAAPVKTNPMQPCWCWTERTEVLARCKIPSSGEHLGLAFSLTPSQTAHFFLPSVPCGFLELSASHQVDFLSKPLSGTPTARAFARDDLKRRILHTYIRARRGTRHGTNPPRARARSLHSPVGKQTKPKPKKKTPNKQIHEAL